MSNKLKNEYDNMTAYIKSAHLEGDSKLTLSDFSKHHSFCSPWPFSTNNLQCLLSFIATRAARKSIIAAMALMVFGIKTHDLPH